MVKNNARNNVREVLLVPYKHGALQENPTPYSVKTGPIKKVATRSTCFVSSGFFIASSML
jgi:hypothetical protein